MTDIKQKALALVNKVLNERGMAGRSCIDRDIYAHEALCRAIEQHEAFRQEVSDALREENERLRILLRRTMNMAINYATGTGTAFDDVIAEANAALQEQSK